ncbi:MAG: hypothetical protein H0W25_16940 [Acidimicrobiia bacterium]|nr:hypothetical protein [Acidimicrobiia bacterium]
MSVPCRSCGRTLVCVDIKTDGRTVTMRSCTRCDRREWLLDGEPTDPIEAFANQ